MAGRPSSSPPRSRRTGATSNRPSSRAPGRPPSGAAPDPRRSLLDAARRLFIARGFGQVSTRELAHTAGVSPAMIAYYFGDKQGLYEALLEDAIGRVLRRIGAPGQDTGSSDRDPRAEPEEPVQAFLTAYIDTLIAEPWIPQLLVREVLAHDSPLRHRFRDNLARRGAAALADLLGGEQAGGRLRSDLDTRLAILSLIGMTVFPFLAQPVFGEVLDYRLDATFRDRLLDHTRRLFLDGARPRETP